MLFQKRRLDKYEQTILFVQDVSFSKFIIFVLILKLNIGKKQADN